MRRARESLSDRERDVTRFLSELQRRLEETGIAQQALASERLELERREKELAREWEKRESAKLKELEIHSRLESMLTSGLAGAS